MCCLAGLLLATQTDSARAEEGSSDLTQKVQVLSVGQMAPADASLLATHRADIAAAAEFHGYNVSSGTWIQSQVACPYAPGYLILHDVQLSQDGFISLFTALVPRGSGKVRIIPVLRHGAQVLRVFGSTPEQRNLIDDVISAPLVTSVPSDNGDWATLAYCYGALAGAEPAAPGSTAPEQSGPRLALDENGKVREMSFSVLGPDHFYQDWRIQFDGHGKVKLIGLSARELRPPQGIPQQQPRARAIPDSQQPTANPIRPPR